MKYIGGYSILDLTDANVHAQANACYNQDKPVLVYGANGERYFADTITKSGTSFIITKGGKTITIANDNTITNVGSVTNPTMENIVDLNGNKRFVEGEITTNTITGITFNYSKWSLSGTHLMIVISGTIENGTEVPFSTIAENIKLPQYVKDKIQVLFGGIIVTRNTITLYANDNSTQSVVTSLYKQNNGNIDISMSTITLSATRSFRMQYDLLIDQD